MRAEHNPFDIVILGGGPVGQACALLLARHWSDPSRIALIDAKSAEQSVQDPRTLALSQGSRQILERVAGWPEHAVTPIETIHVSHRGHFGRTRIQRREYGLPALGYVTSYGALIGQLQQQVERSGICVLRPVTALACDDTATGVCVHTDANTHTADHDAHDAHDAGKIFASLAIHAEGGLLHQQSTSDPHATQHDYHQHALVSFVTTTASGTERLPRHTAFERFTDQGPLALLPHQHQGQAGYALVWCCRPTHAQGLLAQSDAEFLSALQQAFGQRVGKFSSVAARHTFPLKLSLHEHLATGHSVRIGNAAQTLHPVAGQGLNLGLRDALTLTDLLHSQPFATSVLQHYPARRQADRHITRHATSLLASLFADHGTLIAPLASTSLALLDLLPTLKKPLAQQMIFGQR